MKKLGVVGGIASGKSHVAKTFESWGARRIDGDQLGHAALDLPKVQQQLQSRWGDRIFDDDGNISRRIIAGIVFQPAPEGTKELAFLEGVTHPFINQLIGESIEVARSDGCRAVVIDAAVMLKAGWAHHCDHLIFVDASRPIRMKRALARGWSEEQFAAREATQWPLERKREKCEFVITTDESFEKTRQQAIEIWQRVFGAAPELA